MVIGLVRPDSGTVSLDDVEISAWPMHRRAQQGVAYLPQDASVFRRMTAEENILSVLETLPLSSLERKQQLQKLLDEFSLNSIARQKAYSLSGGERRRVEVARALAINPSFLLLDEPFAGIDPIAVIEIQRIINFLKSRGIGVLITDHNVRETLGICDHACIISDGRVLAQGTPREIIENADVRRVYLGEHFRM